MKNNELIKKAQNECGEYATGYKADLTEDSIVKVCEYVWTRSANLGYSFSQWWEEVYNVIGKTAYFFWLDTILDFQHAMEQQLKYTVCLGKKYCIK